MVVSNDPNHAVLKVDWVDYHEVCIKANQLKEMPWNAKPQRVHVGPKTVSRPPFPCRKWLHSFHIALRLSIEEGIGYFFSLLNLIWMLFHMNWNHHIRHPNCEKSDEGDPTLPVQLHTVPAYRVTPVLQLFHKVFARQVGELIFFRVLDAHFFIFLTHSFFGK